LLISLARCRVRQEEASYKRVISPFCNSLNGLSDKMKIKVILTQDFYQHDYDDYDSNRIITSGITEWEEVTPKEFEFLRQNIKKINVNDQNAIIVQQDDIPVIRRIADIKEYIKKEVAAEEARREKEKKIAEDKKTAWLLKKKTKIEADELLLLKTLQEKYK